MSTNSLSLLSLIQLIFCKNATSPWKGSETCLRCLKNRHYLSLSLTAFSQHFFYSLLSDIWNSARAHSFEKQKILSLFPSLLWQLTAWVINSLQSFSTRSASSFSVRVQYLREECLIRNLVIQMLQHLSLSFWQHHRAWLKDSLQSFSILSWLFPSSLSSSHCFRPLSHPLPHFLAVEMFEKLFLFFTAWLLNSLSL